jgi:hypothetical protein
VLGASPTGKTFFLQFLIRNKRKSNLGLAWQLFVVTITLFYLIKYVPRHDREKIKIKERATQKFADGRRTTFNHTMGPLHR